MRLARALPWLELCCMIRTVSHRTRTTTPARITNCKQVTLEPDGTLTAIRRDVEPRSLAELAYPDRMFVAH